MSRYAMNWVSHKERKEKLEEYAALCIQNYWRTYRRLSSSTNSANKESFLHSVRSKSNKNKKLIFVNTFSGGGDSDYCSYKIIVELVKGDFYTENIMF